MPDFPRLPSLNVPLLNADQPGWTLVGSGLAHLSDLSKPLVDVIPSGATHIPEAVETFHPEKNMVVTKGGREIT